MPVRLANTILGAISVVVVIATATCLGGSYPEIFGLDAILSRVHRQASSGAGTSISQTTVEQKPVTQMIDPPEASGLPISHLADLVTTLLPPAGFEQLGWDYLAAQPNIHWLTNGYADRGNGAERTGLARVRVGRRESTRLLQSLNELAWSITLATDENPRFGPKSIEVDVGYGSDKQCFGTLDNGCTFTAADALSSKSLTAQRVCELDESGGIKQVFDVSAVGKANLLVVVSQNEGSGGASSTLSILPEEQRSSACKRS